MTVKYSNDASTTLVNGITSTSTSITVTSAINFPILAEGDYTHLTLANVIGSAKEIVKCTAINGNVLTVVRGKETTTPRAFDAGDKVELRITAGLLDFAISEGNSSGTADFVASGTLPNGAPVVLKADGTVEVVAQLSVTIVESIPAGSGVIGNDLGGREAAIAFDPSNANKFVYAYKSTFNRGEAVVGTVSGTSITFGPAVVFNNTSTNRISLAFDPYNANKFVIAYIDTSNYGHGKGIVGTISGTSVSFENASTFHQDATNHPRVSFDPNTENKLVITYKNLSSNEGIAVVGTVSDTSITFGTAVAFSSDWIDNPRVSFDPDTAGKFVVVYLFDTNLHYGAAVVGTISGSSVSFGTPVTFNSGSTNYSEVVFNPDTAGKFVVVYTDFTNSASGKAITGTVSGTAITFGTAVVFNNASTGHISLAFDPNTAGKFVVVYADAGNSSRPTAIVGTTQGTSITFAPSVAINNSTSGHQALAFDPSTPGNFVAIYNDGNNFGKGTAIVCQLDATFLQHNLTTANFLGLSTEAYTNDQTATISIRGGISINQANLTVATPYYVQRDGTLGPAAGATHVYAGTALSATNLSLDGPSDTLSISAAEVALNTDKVSNIDHPLVEKAVPSDAVFTDTDTVYDDTALVTAIGLNTAKVSNVDHPLVEKAVPSNAVFTDTVYDSTAIDIAVGLNTAKETNYNQTKADIEALGIAADSITGALPAISGAALTDLPSGGGGTADFVSSGTLPNGAPVILKADGTIEVVSGTIVPETAGSHTTFTGNCMHTEVVVLSATKAIVAYIDMDNNNYVTACILDISGMTITSGTPIVVQSVRSENPVLSRLSATKALIAYIVETDNRSGSVCVLDVSGSTITVGPPLAITSGTRCSSLTMVSLTDAQAIVSYMDNGNDYKGTVKALDVDGSTISVGNTKIFTDNYTRVVDPSIAKLADDYALIIYTNSKPQTYSAALDTGTICVIYLPEESSQMRVADKAILTYNGLDAPKVVGLTATRAIVTYGDRSNDYHQVARIIDMEHFGERGGYDVSLTVGAITVFSPFTNLAMSLTKLTDTRVIAIASYQTFVLDVFEDSITSQHYSVYSEDAIRFDRSLAHIESSKVIIAGNVSTTPREGKASIDQLSYSDTNLTANNFVGTSQAEYTDGQTASVMLQGGVSANQSGLTIGSTYYVQEDGTFKTSKDVTPVTAGKALSATSLLLKGI